SARRSSRPSRPTSSTISVVGDHAGLLRHDSWLPGDALARGKTRPPRRAWFLFHADARLYRPNLWKNFLSRARSAAVVFCLPLFSWVWRSQLRRLHALAAGAIPDGMPR